MKIVLGEEESAYAYGGARTSADVGKILEAKYGLFSAFAEANAQNIADDLTASLAKKFEALVAGNGSSDSLSEIGAGVEKRFKNFLDRYEAEGLALPGVPTLAAQKGIRHIVGRKSYGARRPSFVDSGNLRDNFRCLVVK